MIAHLLTILIGLLPIAATLWVKWMLFRQRESEENDEASPGRDFPFPSLQSPAGRHPRTEPRTAFAFSPS